MLGVAREAVPHATGTRADNSSFHAAWGAAYLITFLWLVGYLFLSEKRHVIVKTAYYISSQLEPRHPGLGWERWHLGDVEGREFWRWDPHYVETLISSVVVLLSLGLMWSLDPPLFWKTLSFVTGGVFAFCAYKSIRHYNLAVSRLKNPPLLVIYPPLQPSDPISPVVSSEQSGLLLAGVALIGLLVWRASLKRELPWRSKQR